MHPETRGGDYQVYTGDVLAWLLKRAGGQENVEAVDAEREKALLYRE